MEFGLSKDSALDLTLKGSVGNFSVGGAPKDRDSIDVHYFLTHVGLDFASSSNEAVLSNIAPVRETFDFDQLGFDELMQRDLDDARVSSELIPYLLDTQSRDLVKLFPPIIIAVLPTKEDTVGPGKYYPEVTRSRKPKIVGEKENGEPKTRDYRLTTAGEKGDEVFQFEQPIFEDEVLEHDFVKFKANTNRSSLVIVDGQHRAMALLALYRNLKSKWGNSRAQKYEEYYAQWTPEYINQFDIGEVSLPMMICTFPSLDESYAGDFNLIKAAREVFLTLNKTARQVSETRTILLDDNDLVSSFMRKVLAEVKSRGMQSDYSLRIHNVELDQEKDRIKLSDPVAITGVNHIYYIIEHLLLSEVRKDVNGVKPRSGRFGAREDLASYGMLLRLGGYELLGQKAAESVSRSQFSDKTEKSLTTSFDEKYGQYVVRVLEEMEVFESHNYAALEEKEELDKEKDRKVKPILFEGQGIARNFKRHKENLQEQLNEGYFGKKAPEVKAVLKQLNATDERINKAVNELELKRSINFLRKVPDDELPLDEDGVISKKLVKWVTNKYKNVFKTVAFQAALVCTFFDQLERTFPPHESNPDVEIRNLFEEYINCIDSLFSPSSFDEMKRLVEIFDGQLVEGQEWKVKPTNYTFDDVVRKGYMKPDKWTEYRYLILEAWSTEDEQLAESICQCLEKCRLDVFERVYETNKDEYCEEEMIFEEEISETQKVDIAHESFSQISSFLEIFGAKVSEKSEFIYESIGIEVD